MTSDAEYHQWQLQELEVELDRAHDEIVELKAKLSDFAWVSADIEPPHNGLYIGYNGKVVMPIRWVDGWIEWVSGAPLVGVQFWMPLPDPPQE